jgi:hypothetical protein
MTDFAFPQVVKLQSPSPQRDPFLLYDQKRTFSMQVTEQMTGREGYLQLWNFIHAQGW